MYALYIWSTNPNLTLDYPEMFVCVCTIRLYRKYSMAVEVVTCKKQYNPNNVDDDYVLCCRKRRNADLGLMIFGFLFHVF